jgi:hypothetical protein
MFGSKSKWAKYALAGAALAALAYRLGKSNKELYRKVRHAGDTTTGPRE